MVSISKKLNENKQFNMSPVGNEISAVFFGIDDVFLKDNNFLYKTLKDALLKEKFNIIGESSYAFKPYGYTLVFLLSESHAAIHTYPEYSSLAFQIYSCRSANDGFITYNYLIEKLKPQKIEKKDFNVWVK